MNKLRIEGILEVEGEIDFVKSVYQDYKDGLFLASSNQKIIKNSENKVGNKTVDIKEKKIEVKKKSISALPGTVPKIQELIKQGEPTLKTFFDQKKPENAFEKNLVFIYYLKVHKKVAEVGPDEVFTCYKSLGEEYSNAFAQSLRDTASKKRWIDTTDMKNILITTNGDQHVEHEMPKKDK